MIGEPDRRGGGYYDEEYITAFACLMIVAVMGVPLAIGWLAGTVMRWAWVKWTWALLGLILSLGLFALTGEWDALISRGPISIVAYHKPLGPSLLAVAPTWLAIACAVAAFVAARGERAGKRRRAPGEREPRSLGPIEALAAWREQRRSVRPGEHALGQGVRVGTDSDSGRPAYLPPPRRPVSVLGDSGAGKTTFAVTLAEGLVHNKSALIVLDGKGSRSLASALHSIAKRHGRRFWVVSLDTMNDPMLDSHRVRWNPLLHGNVTEIRDTILSAEVFSEPFYKTTAERGAHSAACCLRLSGRPPDLRDAARLLEDPEKMADTLAASEQAGTLAASEEAGNLGDQIKWLEGLSWQERSALKGLANRLQRVVQSQGGELLVPGAGAKVDLQQAISLGAVVLFSFPAGAYPEHAPQVSKYLTQQVNALCSHAIHDERKLEAMFWVDDVSGLAAGQLPALYERVRESGLVVMTTMQSVANLEALGGERFRAAALGNAELVVAMRQSDRASAEQLAALTGKCWDHRFTSPVDGAGGEFGLFGSGGGTRREIEVPVVSAEEIMNLAPGEAILISRRERREVSRIRVEPAWASP